MKKSHSLYERVAKRIHNIFKFHPTIPKSKYKLDVHTSKGQFIMSLSVVVPENARLQDVQGRFGHNWENFKELPKDFGYKNKVETTGLGYIYYLYKEKV
jgi:hypothetical protein